MAVLKRAKKSDTKVTPMFTEDNVKSLGRQYVDISSQIKALEEQNIPMASAEVTMIPQTYVTLTDEADITNIGRILDFLDDDDDVQEVYHNWEE